MGFWKIWALLVIALVILGWIRGKHFLAFSTAGFVGLGGLMVLDRASEADQPSNSIPVSYTHLTLPTNREV